MNGFALCKKNFVKISTASIVQQKNINLRRMWYAGEELCRKKDDYVERKSYSCFFSSNGMFLNLGALWLESRWNSPIFIIYKSLDPLELKIKL